MMSHGVKRQRESPEKEAAILEKERVQVNEYRALLDDVMTRVLHRSRQQLIYNSEVSGTSREKLSA